MSKYLFTSESVTKGHPDKICDQISDAILDAMLEQDPQSRVACETTCTTGQVLVMGEITSKAQVDIPSIVRKTICDIGYDNGVKGFDGNNCAVLVALDQADSCKKATAAADNLRAQIKDYLEDSARARMEVDVARREIERLNREISNLRERLSQ